MNAMPSFRKPTLAVVIAFCDSTPDDPMPRPYVVAQPANNEGLHDLWNMPVHPDMTNLDIFAQFAEDYLLNPKELRTIGLAQLARMEISTHYLRVFVASRYMRWQEFQRLDDKALVPFTAARKQLIWTETTKLVLETAYRTKGMRMLREYSKLVRPNPAVMPQHGHP